MAFTLKSPAFGHGDPIPASIRWMAQAFHRRSSRPIPRPPRKAFLLIVEDYISRQIRAKATSAQMSSVRSSPGCVKK
jgi:hypothetical protein